MKKFRYAIITAALILLALCLVGCSDKNKAETYFNGFSSQGQFTKAEQKVVIDTPDTAIFSYDVENDIFITSRPVINSYDQTGYTYLYGMVSPTEGTLCEPKYTGIISINGDYAIVTKPAFIASDEKYTSTIGVVKFRGENQGDLTAFQTAYNSSFSQFYFAGDYIACPGNKEFPFSTVPYTTFYDYSTGQMLETFKIRCGYDYEISVYEDYVVAVKKDHAFFYDVNDVQSDGFLAYDERGAYLAYPEDTDAEYTDNIEIGIFYLGNGWFSRTARLKSTEEFVGYNIMYEDVDMITGSSQIIYANIRCDFYNAKDRTTTDRQGLIVDNVANKFYTDYYAQYASYLNNSVTFDEGTGDYNYSLPYMDISALIKEGYSIVYYYYFPYIDEGSYQSEITFCVMDKAANIISLDDMLMPAVYVDGIGTETSDPLYAEYYGAVHCFDKNLKKHEMLPINEGTETYSTFIYHGKGSVAGKIDYQNKTVKYGIVSYDGKLAVPFIYDELTPFYGEYSLGSKTEGGKQWYRISANGDTEKIYDVVNVKQGSYVYNSQGKLGLKNYAGDILLEAVFDKLEVYEVFLTGGMYQTSYAIAVKDGITKIYRLG